MLFNKNKKNRKFSIKKTTLGVFSLLVSTTIFGNEINYVNAQTVEAKYEVNQDVSITINEIDNNKVEIVAKALKDVENAILKVNIAGLNYTFNYGNLKEGEAKLEVLDIKAGEKSLPKTSAKKEKRELTAKAIVHNSIVQATLEYEVSIENKSLEYYTKKVAEPTVENILEFLNTNVSDKSDTTKVDRPEAKPETPKVDEPVVKPESPKVNKPVVKPEYPKADEQVVKPETPKVENPVVKDETTNTNGPKIIYTDNNNLLSEIFKEVLKKDIDKPAYFLETPKVEKPVVKPETPKVDEPVVKPETPKVDEPVVKPETPKADEPVVKPETPKVDEPAVQPETPKVDEPVVQPETPKVDEPVVKPETPKVDEPAEQPTERVDNTPHGEVRVKYDIKLLNETFAELMRDYFKDDYRYDPTLQKAANIRAHELAEVNTIRPYGPHTRPDGSPWATVFRETEEQERPVAENTASFQPTTYLLSQINGDKLTDIHGDEQAIAQELFNIWEASEGHNAGMGRSMTFALGVDLSKYNTVFGVFIGGMANQDQEAEYAVNNGNN